MTTSPDRNNGGITAADRDERGRFRPGNGGRPKGARHRLTVLAERMMEDEAGEVVTVVIAAAKAGDMIAARLILERIAPPRKGRPVAFDLPRIDTAADVLAALGAVLGAVAAGTLTPDEGVTIAGLLDAQRRAIETADIEHRLSELEARQ